MKPSVIFVNYIVLILAFASIYTLFPEALGISVKNLCDGFYFSVVIMTTLGFGDIAPANMFGRIFVSVQVILGVTTFGFFLNSVARSQAQEIDKAERALVEENRNHLAESLRKQACLIIDVFKSGNPFAWDKHVEHAAPIEELESFCRETYKSLKNGQHKIGVLQIKSLLEISDQNYDAFVALTPAATKISSNFLLNWVSLTSHIRFLSQEYQKTISNVSADGAYNWPTGSELALQIMEILKVTLVICGKSIDLLDK